MSPFFNPYNFNNASKENKSAGLIALVIVGVISLLFLCGCTDRTSQSVKTDNQNWLSSDGELVGKFKDGKELRRYAISMGNSPGNFTHWVYRVEDESIVTINHVENHGKNNDVNHIEVLIDGKKYRQIDEEN